jgi:hypothetical protein
MLLQEITIDQNVVYVDDDKVIKPFLENIVHESAKCGRCIGEPKRYHQEFVWVIPHAISSFFFIPFRNSNLVIPQM